MRLRLGRLAAAVFLALGAGAVAVQSPAAAVPDPVFIQSAMTNACLDQHYNNGPTTIVYAWSTCHWDRPNQRWGWVHHKNDLWRIVNHRDGWCLSEPNLDSTRVFAEVCDPRRPAKQLWRQVATPGGFGLIKNSYTGRCMRAHHDKPDVNGGQCNDLGVGQWLEWHWQPAPW